MSDINTLYDTKPQKKNTAYTKDILQKRFNQLKTEHQAWVPAYKDLSMYINPTRGIFNNDRTRIGKMIDHKTLLSSYATHAQRIFSSGLNSGMTNKASNWFRLTIDDLEYFEIPGVREWLETVEGMMYDVINKSNLYDAFYAAYEELAQFGTACFVVVGDYDDVIRARTFTAGEYFLSVDNKGRVNAFAREFEMTVEQCVAEFGLESCSASVKVSYSNNQRQIKVKICHLIEAHNTRDPEMMDEGNKAYKSCYWELGNGEEGFLARRGYDRFVIIAPRWDVITTNMVYGYSPGYHAVGAIKELQKTRRDKLIMQDKIGNPPVQQDGSVIGHANLLPGGVTRTSASVPNAGVKAAYQVPPAIDMFIEAQNELKEEIDRFFFVNLFQMLMNVDQGKMTATEVAERQQEKIMMMGPALHKMDGEMLTPTLELVFAEMMDNGMFPDPPEELQGVDLKIEYTSILAQAQKALGITKIERVLGLVGMVAPIFPGVMDNIDIDEVVRQVNDLEGASPKIILDKEEVAEIREQKAQQQQMAMAAEMANSAADTTKKLADAPANQGSVLDGLANAFGKVNK